MYRKCNHVYTTVAQKLVIESASVTVECKGKLHNQTGKGKEINKKKREKRRNEPDKNNFKPTGMTN